MSAKPRLLDVISAAQYLGGISTWTLRGLVAKGEIVPVRLPSTRRPGEQSRRLLFDRADLDVLIEASKDASTCEPNAGLSAASIKGWNQRREAERSAR